MDNKQTCNPGAARVPSAQERVGGEALRQEIDAVARNPVIDNVLKSVYGLLAVLNEHRQVLAVNDALLASLGVSEAERLLGLRPGEVVQCVHAEEEAGGCGTSTYCSTCGAAIAIVTTLGTSEPSERECAIVAKRGDKVVDLYFHVRCCPMLVEGQRFLLLFLRDTSADQQRAVLERVFYHDISNLIENLLANTRQLRGLSRECGAQELAEQVLELTSRLAKEVRIQRTLSRGPEEHEVAMRDVPLERVVANLRKAFRNHPAAEGKRLSAPEIPPRARIHTDAYLLERVLTNMLINAFEAAEAGGEIRLWTEDARHETVFCVWNRQTMPEDVARRVFQRNFTTKPGQGRGIGAFAMKLIAETYLGGSVDFTSTAAEGTVFRLRLPKNRDPGGGLHE